MELFKEIPIVKNGVVLYLDNKLIFICNLCYVKVLRQTVTIEDILYRIRNHIKN